MIKRLLAATTAIAIILSFTTIAQADNSDDVESKPFVAAGVRFLTDEEEEEYLQSLSEEDLQKIYEKEQEAEELADQPMTRSVSKISIPGSFTMFQQENYYYCVPACVKSVLYYNNIIVTQTSVAKSLGTEPGIGTRVEAIVPYLNQKQSFYYARAGTPTQTTMCDRLYATIANNKKPCMMGIINLSGNGWHYATSGHFLVVNAIYSDKSRIQLADPLGGTQVGYTYYYEKSAYIAGQVCKDLIW